MEEIAVHLKPGREKSVREGHPWIFSGAVDRVDGPGNAPVVRVLDAAARPLGLGLYSPKSQIRVRMLGAGVERVDRDFFAARIAEASALRESVLPADTTGYRLINSEGDNLPGWTVDRFGDALVSQVTVAGLETIRAEAYAALRDAFPGCSILQMNDVPARRAEGLETKEDEVVAGEPPAAAHFTESGFRFTAEIADGQKTGFYCDQRENRRRTERLAAGRAVLDLFAHTGAFALYALRGGARQVVCVESAGRLIDHGRLHVEMNGFGDDRVEWVRANVFQDLRERTERYGLVVCDPPPLVKKRQDVDAAARAYKDLNRLALARIEPGGFLLTFSCSGAVDAKLFRQIFFAAAVEARVRVALLEPLAAAPDHPVAITHPQGEYLKGWLARVTGPVL